MHSLQNIPALITGGASGLGAATARVLASEGAKVALLDLNKEAAQKIADEIGGIALACDVTDGASAEAAVAQAAEVHGAARILINCAGILIGKRIVGKQGAADLEHFQKVINVNLVGGFNLMRLAASGMSSLPPLGDDHERGVIINTASIAAYEGQIGQAAYAASKGGIVSLTLPAARELASHGIRVMAIAPGMVATPMIGTLNNEVQQALESTVPFPPRFALPEEFAALVVHILSNRMLNGEVIRLDGACRLAGK